MPPNYRRKAPILNAEQLTSDCTGPQPERTATLSTYYAIRENYLVSIIGASVGVVSVFTAGILPFPWSKSYDVCVEATSEDGLNRFAAAEGNLYLLWNWWAFGFRSDDLDAVATKLMNDLTNQAWQKMWLLQGENLGDEDCRRTLTHPRQVNDTVRP